MKTSAPATRSFHLPVLALTLALALAACSTAPREPAQTTATNTAPSHSAPTPPPAPAPVETPRQRIERALRGFWNDDEMLERTLQLPRTAPGFIAVKAAVQEIYADPLVLDSLAEEVIAGTPAGQLPATLMRRMVSGLNRLDDDAAMRWLRSYAAVMGRLNPDQCRDVLQSQGSAQLGRLAAHMTPNEVRDFFDVFHLGWRAELQGTPLRPPINPADRDRAFTEIGRRFKSGLPGQSDCARFSAYVAVAESLPPRSKTAIVSFFLSAMGSAVRKSAETR